MKTGVAECTAGEPNMHQGVEIFSWNLSATVCVLRLLFVFLFVMKC